MTPRRAVASASVTLVLLAVLSAGAKAQQPLVESGPFSLDLSGYVRSLTGIHDAGYELFDLERRSSFHSQVLRLGWRVGWGPSLVLDVQQRTQVRISSSSAGLAGSVAGFGVSADPGRALDLESVWNPDDRTRVSHDLDRLAVTAYTSVADVTVGRQAVTWGTSLLFPVMDLWVGFSPYELDTEEKPGVDGVRFLAYPAPGLEVDAVMADRGDRDDVSAGVRAAWSLPSADIHGALGRLWNEALVAGGVTWILETTKLRLEGVAARDLDRGRWLDPRITAGFDWIGSRWSFTAEYHFNGLGVSEPDAYLERLRSESFRRGESYYPGRHYLGGSGSWSVDAQERLRLSATVIANLGDPSGGVLPVAVWDLSGSTTLSLGGLVALGEEPLQTRPAPRLRSEYGTYGSLGYAQLAIYF